MAERQTIQLGLLAANEPGSIAIGPFGSRMKAELYVATGVPIIRGTNISSGSSWKGDWVYVPEAFAAEMPNCLTRAGDLVFPHRGSIGEVALVPDDGITYMISTSLMKFRPDTRRVSPEFLLHFFRSAKGRAEILRFASQVGTPGIGQPLTSLRQFRVDLPPLPTQRAIAATLGSLNDKIELNRRMNETLEAMARAIFQDWFVAFGPTRAKLEGRSPYLAPDLWALFPDRLDAEGKPEGWERRTLAEVFDINPSDRLPLGVMAPYLDMSALPVRGTETERPTMRPAGSGARFRNGDTLFARITPCLENGKTALVTCLPAGAIGWGSTEFIVMRPHPPIPVAYGYLLARDVNFRANAIRAMTGTSGRQRVPVDGIRTYPLVKPGDPVFAAFDEIVCPLFDRIFANSTEVETLAATRDLLLPRLMSGELRVEDAERAIEAAA